MITFKRIYHTLSCTSTEIQERKYPAKRYNKKKMIGDVPEMLDFFCFQLTIRDDEVQRLNSKIRQLHSEIRDLQAQLELKDERVSKK